jgi:hypothetical protein
MPLIQPSLRDLCTARRATPTLKRWAIVGRSLRDEDMRDPCVGRLPDPPASTFAAGAAESDGGIDCAMRAEKGIISLADLFLTFLRRDG